MKTMLISLLAGITVLTSCAPEQADSQTDKGIDKREAVLSVIHSRKSVRAFVKDKPVSEADLTTLLQAGMAAPTAVNKQPWHFIVVNERAKLDQLAEKLPYAKMLKDVCAAIVVCGDTTIHIGGQRFWMFDCSVASENILLAAEAMGLGAVWTAVYPDLQRIDAVKEALSIPDSIMPLNVIPLGYPTGKDQPKNKFDETKIHRNGW